MRKKVLGLVMAAMAISTIGAFAQTENASSSNETCTEQTSECCNSSKDKKKKGDRKKGDKGECKKAKRDFFKGIELTEEQRQQIDALRKERQAKRDAEKEAKEKEREEFNAEIERILTPEQYEIYKQNCENLKSKKHSKGNQKVRAKAQRVNTNVKASDLKSSTL